MFIYMSINFCSALKVPKEIWRIVDVMLQSDDIKKDVSLFVTPGDPNEVKSYIYIYIYIFFFFKITFFNLMIEIFL